MIVSEMKAMLDAFLERVPDGESNRLVWNLCGDKHRWADAHCLHSALRQKNLEATKRADPIAEAQYCFEEVCAQTLFNLAGSGAPFDSDAPYWVIKNALILANRLGIPSQKIVEIVAPN